MENARLVWKCTALHTTLPNLPVERGVIGWKPKIANVCRIFWRCNGLRTTLHNLPVPMENTRVNGLRTLFVQIEQKN